MVLARELYTPKSDSNSPKSPINVTSTRSGHASAEYPIFVTPAGIRILVIAQLLKASDSIVVNLLSFSNSTSPILEQPPNADAPMAVTLAGMLIFSNLLQP